MSDKLVLITGGDRGIGKATAYEFARAGFGLIITYFENETGAQETRQKCLQLGARKVSIFQLDLSSNESIERVVSQVLRETETIDVLINNAGVVLNKPVHELTYSEIDWQFGVNLAGSIKLTAKILPGIRRAVVNIGSTLGLRGKRGLSVYSASKFGLRGFTQALAQERKDLLVFAIHPGLTNTRMGNLEGMAPERVARVIYQAVCGKFRRVSGSDIKVKFYAQGLAGRILYLMQEFAKKVLGR